MPRNPPAPLTPAERVARSRARAIEAGARRLPTGVLPADAAQALDTLLARGYAPSATAAIARALREAHAAR